MGDTTQAAPVGALNALRVAHVELEVVAGPDARKAHDVPAGGSVIGTSPDCDFQLTDPQISRRHVELRPAEGGVRVVDLDSRNGTLFHGARITSAVLSEDALLTLGATTIAVRLGAEPLEVALSQRSELGGAIGLSPAMRHVFSLLEQAANKNVTVLFEGESGTGKDVLATALHNESPRRESPFVVVDCGAIPENLIESELFGHEKGAFTGAVASQPGAFEQADGGTVFLDEIGELPLQMQTKLLRVLESRRFRRLGGRQEISVDVRVVAATNKRLSEAVQRGEFRADLYYRLAVAQVRVPPLRERRDDILPLAELFLRRLRGDDNATLPPDLVSLLLSYDWPGNARELRNVVERFATFADTPVSNLLGEPVPLDGSGEGVIQIDPLARANLSYHEAKQRVVREFHRSFLPKVIDLAGGSIPKAADRLGIPRASVYRMLKNATEDPASEEES